MKASASGDVTALAACRLRTASEGGPYKEDPGAGPSKLKVNKRPASQVATTGHSGDYCRTFWKRSKAQSISSR